MIQIRWRALTVATVLIVPAVLGAQGAAPAPAATPLPPEKQIAAAVLALPKEMRDGAAVLGYNAAGQLVTLRAGKNDMICLAGDPKEARFHSACYHKSMEPFMARGRELRAQGVKDPQVDTVRFKEVATGKIKMPTAPASLYQLFGAPGSYDPATNEVKSPRSLFVVYIPFATPATTGLSGQPQRDAPWIMFPGTPKAHIMFSVGM